MKTPAGPAAAPWLRLLNLGSEINRTHRILMMTAGMLLGTLGIGMTVIQSPWLEKRRQMGVELDEEKQRSELLHSIHRQKELLKKTETEMLLVGGSPELTSAVSKLAAESQLAIESVIPQPDQKVPPYTRFQIEIHATAGMDALIRFLKRVDDHRPSLFLNELEIGEETPAPAFPAPAVKPDGVQRLRLRISALGRTRTPR